jgi:NADH-quinone oxidoreductase subunit N
MTHSSRFHKVAILLAAAAVLVMSQDYMAKRDLLRFEPDPDCAVR